jgi:trimethylamine---corrinoid protein Co-methyltransferase
MRKMQRNRMDALAPQIDEASLALLDDPGVRIEHDGILGLLLAKGARTGAASSVVRIPPGLVRDCLAAAPASFSLEAKRGPSVVLSPESDPVFWSVPGMAIYRGGVHRPFTSADMADVARLLNHLPNVHAIFGLALDDVPPPARDVAGLNIIARNSGKHIRVLCFSPEGAETLVQMQAIVGKRPWFSIGFTAHGPLRWTHLALEIFRRTAGHRIPTSINGEPMAGVSGPVTLAGAAGVGNAEILAGLVVNQLLEPGRPCIYNLGLAHVFDMRTAVAVTGGPENALFAELSAAMGRFYGLPSASWVSTESMCPDSQAALEKSFGFHTHAQAGVGVIWGIGQLESEITISPAQAVIDDEIISYARRHWRGIAVDADSLAVSVCREVGIAGSFLGHEHTLEHYRDELFSPAVLCRVRRPTWDKTGSRRLDDKAEEMAAQLMSKPVSNGLSADQCAELDRIQGSFLRQITRM